MADLKIAYLVGDIRVAQQDIDDIMATALDSIGYWCGRAEAIGRNLGTYASDQISRGGALILHDIESSDRHLLTLGKFMDGLKTACEQGIVTPDEGLIDAGDVDGDAADAIVQLALFGEVVYG